jgi:MFS family permease
MDRTEARRAIAPQLYAFTSSLGGATQGFITVTLGYVLAKQGFSVAAIAGLIGLRLLPETWRIVFGPVLDASLRPRLWFLISAAGSAVCVAGFAVIPLHPGSIALLSILALATGAFANLGIVAQAASIAVTAAPSVRGRIAGWSQAGNLAGTGIGGGLGLWLASHVGMTAAAGALVLWVLACAWPMLLIRTPRAGATLPMRAVGRELVREVTALAVSRSGLLVILAVTLPMGLGSFLGLVSSVSSQWHASADLTATTTGALAGLASVPGCLIGGYLCDRRSPQAMLAWGGLLCAIGEAAMALAPRTPVCFVTFIILNNVLLGFAWAAVAAVIFNALKTTSGGTIGALLGSLCNLPVVVMTFVLGAADARYGVTGMMSLEAAAGAMSAALYGLAAWRWSRPPAMAFATG